MSSWTSHTIWTGGTAGCLTGASIGGEDLLLAGTSTGVLVSSDGGRSWSPFTSDSSVVMVETVARTSSNATIAGGPTGLFRSDGGATSWRSLLAAHIHAVVAFENRAGNECLVAGTDLDGIIRSEDDGRTWQSANPGLLDLTVLALVSSPVAGGARTLFAGTTSGLYVSRNDGKAWRPAELPGDECAIQCLAVSPAWATDRLAFAGTEASGLLQSWDGGLRWEVVSHFGSRGVSTIACVGGDDRPLHVAVASGSQIALSEDGGQTWHEVAEVSGEVASLRFVKSSDHQFLVVGQFDEGICVLERVQPPERS